MAKGSNGCEEKGLAGNRGGKQRQPGFDKGERWGVVASGPRKSEEEERAAGMVRGLRIDPVGVVEDKRKRRIVHDSTYSGKPETRGGEVVAS